MNSLLKYMLGGMVAGGILPGMLHLLKITVFASVEGIITHMIGAISGIIIGLVIYKLRNK